MGMPYCVSPQCKNPAYMPLAVSRSLVVLILLLTETTNSVVILIIIVMNMFNAVHLSMQLSIP